MSRDTAASILYCEGLKPFMQDAEDLPTVELTLGLAKGEILGITGPHDSHRRSYLRALAGMLPSRCSRLEIAGLDCRVLDSKTELELRQRTAFISASLPLLANLSVLANVMLPNVYHRRQAPEKCRSQALSLLELVGFQGSPEQLPYQLNHEQSLRVQLARSLSTQPQVLFVDEPFNLDHTENWQEISHLYKKLSQTFDCALIILTSNTVFLRNYADQIMFVGDTHVQSFQPAASMFNDTAPTAIKQFVEHLSVRAMPV